jgi:chromosome partitioning protein
MGKTYVVGNFKGGVGKTKTVTMLSYIASQYKNRKTLVIDLDPQGNATSVLAKTGNITNIDKNVTNAFENEDLESQIINVLPNLDMVGANTKFSRLPKLLMQKFPNDDRKQISYLKHLIEPIKNKYDSIYLDVPPTISDFSDNAMLASDYCIIILQTQELSLDGAKTYINYMQYLIDTYDIDIDIAGILPCMLRPSGRVDQKILDDAKSLYGNNVLNTIVTYQERLKLYDSEGITNKKMYTGTPDQWDRKAHAVFENVLDELDYHEKELSEYGG